MITIARKIFADDRFATEVTGVVIDEVTPDKVVCHLDIKPHHRNAKGAVMGGVLFTLADFAFAVAANAELLPAIAEGSADLQWVSSSANINFLTQPKGDWLQAVATRVRQGRTQALFQISVIDSANRLIALTTTSASKIQ